MSKEFDSLAAFLARNAGIVIERDKQYLVESRLSPVARKSGLAGVNELIQRLERGGDTALAQSVIDAMTTNETFFFRDRVPFERFSEVMLPHLLKTRSAEKRIRIWSAACSTGQEAYSLAMILDENAAKLAGWTVEIVGTDLCTTVLENARNATYSQFEVQRGLPIQLLMKHFTQEGDRWRLNQKLHSYVTFKQFNLMQDYSPLGRFDVIFCRNVLIYFDVPRKQDILRRFVPALAPDGFLLLGSAETVIGLSDHFVPHPQYMPVCVPKTALAASATAAPLAATGTASAMPVRAPAPTSFGTSTTSFAASRPAAPTSVAPSTNASALAPGSLSSASTSSGVNSAGFKPTTSRQHNPVAPATSNPGTYEPRPKAPVAAAAPAEVKEPVKLPPLTTSRFSISR
jgi:chemotaxis protein methyltransferase CheR